MELLDFFFLDLDGCSIGNIKNERIPMIISEYMGYKNTYLKINRNFDRLTFLLYIFDYIFGRAIFEVSQYEFDQKMEIHGFLKNIRKLFIELNKRNRMIPYVPYLYEFIELKEDELSKINKLLQKS